jgi:hypothetical protein
VPDSPRDGTGLLAEAAVVEKGGERAHPPAVEVRELLHEPRQVLGLWRQGDAGHLVGERLKDAHAAVDTGLVIGQSFDKAVAVAVPAPGYADGESGEHEGIEAIRVHLDVLDIVDSDAAEYRRDEAAGLTVADVVDADVEFEFELALEGFAPKDVRVTASDVVLLEDERAAAVRGKVGGGSEPAEAGADDDRVQVLLSDMVPPVWPGPPVSRIQRERAVRPVSGYGGGPG